VQAAARRARQARSREARASCVRWAALRARAELRRGGGGKIARAVCVREGFARRR
jgi:hypothetical protein